MKRPDVESIVKSLDTAAVIGEFVFLIPSGTRMIGRCRLPGHDDQGRSLTVHPEYRTWYCSGCNRGGDIVQFLRMMKGYTLDEALEFLKEWQKNQ